MEKAFSCCFTLLGEKFRPNWVSWCWLAWTTSKYTLVTWLWSTCRIYHDETIISWNKFSKASKTGPSDVGKLGVGSQKKTHLFILLHYLKPKKLKLLQTIYDSLLKIANISSWYNKVSVMLRTNFLISWDLITYFVLLEKGGVEIVTVEEGKFYVTEDI